MIGNTVLKDYGIQSEKSDLRAHVCPLARSVYIFPTKDGIQSIDPTVHRLVPVRTGNIVTAKGYLVPPGSIQGCITVTLEEKTWQAVGLRENQTTSDKGRKASYLVKAMIEKGKFPVALIGTEIKNIDLQIEGVDIIVTVEDTRIQVKCDFRGGGIRGVNKCTGNLFLQIEECNPYQQY